jgi:hypothetical protein
MDYKEYEGSTTSPKKIDVTRKTIAVYAKSINEAELVFFEIEEARRRGYAEIPAPTCMPMIFWQYLDVPWMNHGESFIHKNQTFKYFEPLIAGQTYTCSITLKSVESKRSFTFLENELVGKNDRGDVVFTSTSTLIGGMKK